MGKKILVIGSEGNIGAPLTRYLRSLGHQVKEADLVQGWRPDYSVTDINNPLDILPLFDWEPQVVFILSAMVSRVTCEQAASLAITTNISGLNNILQLCKRGNCKTIFFSTSEVYGPECDLMDEAVADPRPNNRYGFSKLMGERLLEYEVRQHDLKAVALRPFMIYDEEEDLGDHRSAMIRFAYNLSRGKEIEVHNGSARGWFHISDAVRAIEASMHLDGYSVINIGHPDVRSISDLAEMIRARLGASKDLIKTIDLPNRMTLIKRPSLERQRTLLGIVPKVSLEDGVDRVCKRITQR